MGDDTQGDKSVKVNIVCRNWRDDRVLPRFARHLANRNGWSLSDKAIAGYDINYYVAYFEHQRNRQFTGRTAAYFTHLEADSDGAKVKLYNEAAESAWLRMAMNNGQLKHLKKYGRSEVVPLPLEIDRFTPCPHPNREKPVIGFSGYTYKTGRKGEAFAGRLVEHIPGATFKASGRGWPCPIKKYTWEQMPTFFQSLDVFVCTSLVEGGPMTTLEALACGVPVVIPDSVGIHPQLPDILGIYKYRTGDYSDLYAKTLLAIAERDSVDVEELHKATIPHSVETFTYCTRQLFEGLLYDKPPIKALPNYHGKSGVYVVAFGEPSRRCAVDCINSIHQNMPGVPVALCSDRKLGPEDITVIQPDRDIGGRIAKLKAYELAPQGWEYVLYVDADTEITKDVSFLFQLLADGWEFAICKDAHLHDTMESFERRNNKTEHRETIAELGTDEALQINGGVWAFRRCDRTKRYFKRLLEEWNKYQGRDQGAMVRALYRDPLCVYWLCNEWNTLVTAKGEEYPPGIAGTAGIVHRVGKARRWKGQVPDGKGLLDPEAWAMVDNFMRSYK